MSPETPARRAARHVGHQSDAADDGRRRDRPSVGLVVERDVPRDDGETELLRGPRDAFDRLRQLPADLGLLRVPEVETVGETDGLAARARDVEGRSVDGESAGPVRVAFAGRRPVERDGEPPERGAQPEHGRVEARSAHRARADETVVLLEDPRLRLLVGGGRPERARAPARARLARDVVARALVGEEPGRDLASSSPAGEAPKVTGVRDRPDRPTAAPSARRRLRPARRAPA